MRAFILVNILILPVPDKLLSIFGGSDRGDSKIFWANERHFVKQGVV